MFKWKKSEKTTNGAMQLPSDAERRAAYRTGLYGTAEEFRAAHQAAVRMTEPWGTITYCTGASLQRELRWGARDAFGQGRPENVQAIMADIPAFTLRGEFSTEEFSCAYMFSSLIGKHDDAEAVISLVLAKVPDGKKQELLDNGLLEAVTGYIDAADLIGGLMKAGASVKRNDNGELMRAIAMESGQTQRILDLLDKAAATPKNAPAPRPIQSSAKHFKL